MKVTTTACILGAWTPDSQPVKILDIGAGTGILSLMCAQKYGAPTDAVEIDHDAFHQLAENIARSPWPKLINPINADIREFVADEGYDFIITNPPFYQSYLKSPTDGVNRAKHDTALSLRELACCLPFLLSENGIVSILLPPAESHLFRQMAQKEGLYLFREMHIRETDESPISAEVFYFGRKPRQLQSESMVIRQKDGSYSGRFAELMRPYYLNL